MGSFCRFFIRHVPFTINLICALLGLALLVLGALNLTAHMGSNKVSQFLYCVPIVLIVLGSLVLVVSFFGCCGALVESRCMILTYAAFIIFIFIVELLGGIALYSFYNEESVSEDMKQSLTYYETDKDVRKFWDVINDDLHCCGVQSYEDWGDKIPNSCCKDLHINDVCHKEHAYEFGCLDAMLLHIKKIAPILFSLIAVIQILLIVFALCLGMQKKYETV